jgi:hypothetical protein
MITRLYTRTNPHNRQIEIKHFEINSKAQPGDPGPVWMTHFYGTGAPADFYTDDAPAPYSEVDALEVDDTCYIPDLDGALDDFLPRMRKELDAEGWILLPSPDTHRYLAHAADEPEPWHAATGEPIPGHHLVVITEAEPYTSDVDGRQQLAPTGRVAAIIDTGVLAEEPAPNVGELLTEHGWLVVGEGVPGSDDDPGFVEAHEVAPANPVTVAAVDYHAGRPMPYYEAGRRILDERGSLARAVVTAAHVAAETIENPAVWDLTGDDVEEIVLTAARAAVDERLAFECIPALGDADTACKQRLFAEACTAIGDALDMIRQRATCRTCDVHATTRTTDDKPVCSNTCH